MDVADTAMDEAVSTTDAEAEVDSTIVVASTTSRHRHLVSLRLDFSFRLDFSLRLDSRRLSHLRLVSLDCLLHLLDGGPRSTSTQQRLPSHSRPVLALIRVDTTHRDSSVADVEDAEVDTEPTATVRTRTIASNLALCLYNTI